MNRLEILSVKFCESLPFNITIYEKDGKCIKSSDECEYCRKHGDDYLCLKKDYNLTLIY